MTINEELAHIGADLEGRGSDLYVKDSERVRHIIAGWVFSHRCRQFRSQIDGALWWEIPFANGAWWEERAQERQAGNDRF